jgi:predicted transcriptional regulator
MKVKTLAQYLETTTQNAVAAQLGVTQGAIYQMIKTKRNITVIENEDGTVDFIEKKYLNVA